MEMNEYVRKCHEILGLEESELDEALRKRVDNIYSDADKATHALYNYIMENGDAWNKLSTRERLDMIDKIMDEEFAALEKERNAEFGNPKKFMVETVYRPQLAFASRVDIGENRYMVIYGKYNNTYYCILPELNWSAEVSDPDDIEVNTEKIFECVNDEIAARELALAIQFQYAYKKIYHVFEE